MIKKKIIHKYKGFFLLCFIMLTGLTGCSQETQQPKQDKEQPTVNVDKQEVQDIDSIGLKEDKTVYTEDEDMSVAAVYVTVQMGDEGSDTAHTFTEVNSAVRFADGAHVENDVYARALVQFGDETGPLAGQFGYEDTTSNATIRVRGNSSSTSPQKSYKLKLDKDAGTWRGQRNIALNKSFFDVTRFRNKLYFDMLRNVEGAASLRTQFVHVYIKDETAGETAFADYGLYTQAEVPGTRYLDNHGLDSEGYLYKAISFNFEPNSAIRETTDPDFDQDAFDTVLSCKGRKDHSKIMEMIEAVNDTGKDINDIIDTYFDRENYITWLAYNILMANIDTTMQNFYLYSPTNSQKWYFIPWDSDGSLHWQEHEIEGQAAYYDEYNHGIGNWWGVILHQRFLKQADNRQALADKVDELYSVINGETVNAKAKQYNKVVESYVTAMPDLYYLGHTPKERMEIVNGLGTMVDKAYQEFHNSLGSLMPFWLEGLEEGHLSWSEAYAFDAAALTYRVQVSRYPDMRDPAVDKKTDVNFLEVKDLDSGTWYWKVTASAEDGRTVNAMDKFSMDDVFYPGVGVLEVP